MRGPRTAMKSGPLLPQLEKALAQKRRPNTPINNKLINFKKKEKKVENFQISHKHVTVILHILNLIKVSL